MVNLFGEMLATVLSKEFFKEILNLFSVGGKSDLERSSAFCKDVILKWMSQADRDTERTSCIVDIIFTICCCVSKEEAIQILNSCCQAKNLTLLEKLLSKGIRVYADDSLFQGWLKSSSLSQAVVNGLRDSCHSFSTYGEENIKYDLAVQTSIIRLCATSEELKALLIDSQTMETILQIMKEFTEQTLKNGLYNKNAVCIVEFICSVTTTILKNSEDCWSFAATHDLMSLLFQMSLDSLMPLVLQDSLNSFEHSEKLYQTLSKAWQTAIDSSVKTRNELVKKDNFIMRAAFVLHSSLFSLKTNKEAAEFLPFCLTFLSTVGNSIVTHKPSYDYSCSVLSEILEKMLPSVEDWNELKEGLDISMMPSILKWKLFYPLPPENSFSFSKEKVQSLILVSKVVSSIFTDVMMLPNSGWDEKYFAQHISKQLPPLLWSLSFWMNRYTHEENEESNGKKLNENFFKMVSHLPPEDVYDLLNNIFNMSLRNGSYWALPFQNLLEIIEVIYPDCIDKFSLLLGEAVVSENEHKHITAQVLIHHIPKESKIVWLKTLLQEFSEMWDSLYQNSIHGKIGELCCYLQDAKVLSSEIQSLLLQVVPNIIRLEFQREKKVLHNLQVTAILSSVVLCVPSMLVQNMWDFYEMLLTSCLKEIKDAAFHKPKDQLLLHQAVSLFSALSQFLHLYCEEEQKQPVSTRKHALSDEIYEDFIALFIYVADVCEKIKPLPQALQIILTNLLEAVEFISGEQLLTILDQPGFFEDESLTENGRETVNIELNNLISTLTSNSRELQLASHSMLLKIMPLLPGLLSDNWKPEEDDDDSDDNEEKIPVKLSQLIDLLIFTNEIVESMLLEIRIGDCCTVVPYTDSYAFATAYLFAWLEILEFISASPSQMRSGYVAHLEETKLLSSMFSNVFRLMPDNPKTCLTGYDAELQKQEGLKLLFVHPPKVTSDFSRWLARNPSHHQQQPASEIVSHVYSSPSSKEIQAIACYTYATAMRKVPASVRTWWNNLDKRSADIVNRFTSKYISSVICVEEIQAVHDNEMQFDNMVVRARPGSREVIATYTIDDSAIELCVQLPTNYPLGPISAERRGKLVIGQQEWRNWLMQLTTVLTYQNGSILDGLTIWKKNLDKKFEGVEECMICYYILHSSTLKLPKLSCHVCRKKFHSACLYKWFHTSNNFTCPLCRNEFSM